MEPTTDYEELQLHTPPKGLVNTWVAIIVGGVAGFTLAGLLADALLDRYSSKSKANRPRFWVVCMLVSSYLLLVPGLILCLFRYSIALSFFGFVKPMNWGDESTFQLVRKLSDNGLFLGAALVTVYAMVIPALKVVLLILAQIWRRRSPRCHRWSRWCIISVQVVSKWASPDMFAYILMLYLFRSMNHPPSLLSSMDLGLGFTCFCVFCVGSTISSLGIRAPEAETSDEQAPPRLCCINGGVVAAMVVALAVGFTAFFARGLATTCMRLYLDMDLMYQQKPELKVFEEFINQLHLPELMRQEVNVWDCTINLARWTGEGDLNCLLAFVLYAVFVILLPCLDMLCLLVAGLTLCRRRRHTRSIPRSLQISRYLRKLSMLDVSLMGVVVIVVSLQQMREKGLVISMDRGLLLLLGAEICHYAASFLVSAAHDNASRQQEEASKIRQNSAGSTDLEAPEEGHEREVEKLGAPSEASTSGRGGSEALSQSEAGTEPQAKV